MTQLGPKLRKFRKFRNVTVRTLANALQINETNLSRMERGQTLLRFEDFQRAMTALNCTVTLTLKCDQFTEIIES